MFGTKKKEITSNQLPPLKDTLHKHAQRSGYQAGIGRTSLSGYPSILSPKGKGWHLEDNVLTPGWMDIEIAPNAVLELLVNVKVDHITLHHFSVPGMV